jgi:phage shock protein E
MKFVFTALAIIILVMIIFNSMRRKSVEKYLQLPPGEVLIVDVRSKAEYDSGHFSTAINISHDQIANQIGKFEPFRQKQIVVYCASGNRSAAALKVLRQKGFENVVNAGAYAGIMKFDKK